MILISQPDPEFVAIRRNLIALDRDLLEVRNRLGRKFRDDQPRVPRGNPDGGQFTKDPGKILVDDKPKAPPPAPLLPDGLFSSGSSPGVLFEEGFDLLRSIFGGPSDAGSDLPFVARAYTPTDTGELEPSGYDLVDRDKTEEFCPRLADVQARTDETVARLRPQFEGQSAQQFGTAVHKDLERQISRLKDPTYQAEVTFAQGMANRPYGEPNSVRLDVIDTSNPDVTCIYDVKTGKSGVSESRSGRFASEVLSAAGIKPKKVLVIEVRPTR